MYSAHTTCVHVCMHMYLLLLHYYKLKTLILHFLKLLKWLLTSYIAPFLFYIMAIRLTCTCTACSITVSQNRLSSRATLLGSLQTGGPTGISPGDPRAFFGKTRFLFSSSLCPQSVSGCCHFV